MANDCQPHFCAGKIDEGIGDSQQLTWSCSMVNKPRTMNGPSRSTCSRFASSPFLSYTVASVSRKQGQSSGRSPGGAGRSTWFSFWYLTTFSSTVATVDVEAARSRLRPAMIAGALRRVVGVVSHVKNVGWGLYLCCGKGCLLRMTNWRQYFVRYASRVGCAWRGCCLW